MKLFITCFGIASLIVSATVSASELSDRAKQLLKEAKVSIDSDLDAAEKQIEVAMELAPNHAEIQFLCGKIMGRQAEDAFLSALSYAKKSLKCLKQAVALEPENIDYRQGLMSFYLGAPSIAGGDEELALEQVKSIFNLDPVKGLSAKLKYFRNTDATEDLVELFKEARKTYPNHAEFHYRHGLYLQEKENYDEAFDAFFMSINAEKDDENEYKLNALYQVGRTSVFSQKNIDDAIKALQEFIKTANHTSRAPPTEWAHFRLAQLFKLSNNEQKMSEYLDLISQTSDKELKRQIRRLRR